MKRGKVVILVNGLIAPVNTSFLAFQLKPELWNETDESNFLLFFKQPNTFLTFFHYNLKNPAGGDSYLALISSASGKTVLRFLNVENWFL